jgi:hypothetical protein
MDEPRIIHPKRPVRIIGILLVIAGVVVFSSDFDGPLRIPGSGPIGVALIAVGAFLSSTKRTPPSDDW